MTHPLMILLEAGASVGPILLTAGLMLALSFYFSGIEIAFLSSSNLKIEVKKKQGQRAAIILSDLKKKVNKVHPAILIGNTIALVIFTQQFDSLLGPWLESLIGIPQSENYLLYTMLISIIGTLVILIFAEYIPKAIFKSLADRIVFPSAYFLAIAYRLMVPIVWFINAISRLILRYILGIKQLTEEQVLSKQDLDVYIRKAVATIGDEDELNEVDTDMLSNALELRETKAREFMIPRTKLEAIPIHASVEEFREKCIETQLSKLIVYGENLDDVKGFVHSRSLFSHPKDIQSCLQEVMVVPESMSAVMMLVEFGENKKSVALVVDEFGGTAGLITMEDLVEEVFGDIEDEYDEPEEEEEDVLKIKNADGSFLLGAGLEIDDLNEEFELELPEEDYYTSLGGLFTYHHEDIPEKGESIVVGKYKLTAKKTEHHRIILIGLKELKE